jgi:transposase
MSALELLLAYKQQPMIEKRFGQLKMDFVVAPVFLKEVSRIQALLCVYFLALLVESLLERELRRAMACEGVEPAAVSRGPGVPPPDGPARD